MTIVISVCYSALLCMQCFVMMYMLCVQGDGANVIRVQAPLLHKFNTAIQLHPDMTADDIVARFQPSELQLNGRSVRSMRASKVKDSQ